MKYSEARPGRVFVIRLEQGEVVHEVLERFAAEKNVRAATVLMVGAANKGSRLVVGPWDGDADPIVPLEHVLTKAHEMAAVGTLFPDEAGRPSLHVHTALGREGGATVGCIRLGVVVWLILEVVMVEIVGTGAKRVKDPVTGFDLLEP
jgi:predicted DNA-binding protein with PD1-like motif